eukprot:NODE_4201_length_1101_cov_109.856851_g4003_i0.p1 GENE.NODE_4201_length_1101_cov_109.856851_g4003_i0~~NODE_4201_length_1101_cov_109.856851_g4003_i0.p1  ORF type:complete len:282 (+),score=61.32 NODE_4201_length_1101_cov_109.856851_g4003_i0:54-848(+)
MPALGEVFPAVLNAADYSNGRLNSDLFFESLWFTPLLIIVGCFAIDYLICRPFFVPKAQYWVLHALFNLWVGVLVHNEMIYVFMNPDQVFVVDFTLNGLKTTVGIGAFHIYHLLATGGNVSREDLIHHLVSGIGVAVIGCLCPYGLLVPHCNYFMCALPGGIDFVLIAMLKYDLVGRMTEKWINRWLNLLCRMPGMMFSCYVGFLNIMKGNTMHVPIWLQCVMVFGGLAHLANSIYYCDKVVGNYHVTKQIQTPKTPKTPAPRD